jgi:hypothetical protein
MSNRMPLPEQAPAAILACGKTVMSWHWSVRLVSGSCRRGRRPSIAGELAGGGIGEDRWAVHDPRLGGVAHGNLHHVDSEQRGSGVAGGLADAAGEFLLVAHRGGARDIDDDGAAGVRSGDHRMGVRAAAGLHLAHLDGAAAVLDVEDAKAAEAFRAHLLRHPLQAAVDAAAGLLDRHDQEVAHDGHVALAARAHDRALQRGRAVGAQPVEVEAVVVADRERVARKAMSVLAKLSSGERSLHLVPSLV